MWESTAAHPCGNLFQRRQASLGRCKTARRAPHPHSSHRPPHGRHKAQAALLVAGSQQVAPEEIRPCVGARTRALRALTRRNCLTVATAGSAGSFSTRRKGGSLEGSQTEGPADTCARNGQGRLGFAATARPVPAHPPKHSAVLNSAAACAPDAAARRGSLH